MYVRVGVASRVVKGGLETDKLFSAMDEIDSQDLGLRLVSNEVEGSHRLHGGCLDVPSLLCAEKSAGQCSPMSYLCPRPCQLCPGHCQLMSKDFQLSVFLLNRRGARHVAVL
jgi:hypothetical protein